MVTMSLELSARHSFNSVQCSFICQTSCSKIRFILVRNSFVRDVPFNERNEKEKKRMKTAAKNVCMRNNNLLFVVDDEKTTEKFHMNVNFFTFLHFHAAMRLRQMKGIDQIKRNKLNQLNWNEFSLFFFALRFYPFQTERKCTVYVCNHFGLYYFS